MIDAALIDFSGTLFRLDFTEEKLRGMLGDGTEGERKVELLRKLTAPTGEPPGLSPEQLEDWRRRDLDPQAHERANMAMLEYAGLDTSSAKRLYAGMRENTNWEPYPDTAEALKLLAENGIRTAVVSNIAWDIRPCFSRIGADGHIDSYVLSFEHGTQKPEERIFRIALGELGVAPQNALMIGDSEGADGGARAIGTRFTAVDPLPVDQRQDALLRIVREELAR